MKKLIYLLCFAFVFNSCTTDDTTEIPNNEDSIFVKKIIITDDIETEITNFNYDGNRLMSITDDDQNDIETFTYEDDLLKKMTYTWDDGVTETTTLTYDSDKNLISFETLDNDPNNNYTYLYELIYTNGIVTGFIAYRNNILNETYSIVENGNTIEIITDSSVGISYTFDTKNNPFKNIFALETISLFQMIDVYVERQINTNNLMNFKEMSNGTLDTDFSYEYTYNQDNYPVSAISYYDDIEDGTVEFFYE